MKRSVRMLALLLALLLLAGCGGGAMSTESMASSGASAPSGTAMPEVPKESMDYSFVTDSSASAAGDRATLTGGVYNDPNAKLIREGRLNIQTTEFDLAVEELEKLIDLLGGYFQNASLQGGSYRNVNANRIGEYTVRIPAQQYGEFMNQAGELGYVTYRNESTQNIGEQYYDTESRLKTQKTKQERLHTLLEKAETMEDIITLENALSDVEYEIERLSSTLNRYDSLVGFSTIYLTLHEVHKVTEQTGVTNSLGQRMVKGFQSSVEDLVDGFQDLLVWFSYNFFGLIILIGVFGLGAVAAGRLVRRRKKRRQLSDQPDNKK